MKNLFEQQNRRGMPLAEKIRPSGFEFFFGQEHLLGKDKPLHKMIDNDSLSSIILWGPAGTGKTTIARIIAAHTNSYFEEFSAVTSGVNDLRRVVREAKDRKDFHNQTTILFVDEIHRFNKSQQDGFLPHVEKGTLVIIGATTENPGFEINSALLSRSTVFELKKLSETDLAQIIHQALKDDKNGLGEKKLTIDNKALDFLIKVSDGDARKALNTLEMVANQTPAKSKISYKKINEAVSKKIPSLYKNGDEHYNLISAFIKSMRGSDPDAAIYWLARMIESGEDPKFIARRMIVFASEDIGNAAPMALVLALACFEAVERIGLPEARINLAQGVAYLACAPKSNASYLAISEALVDVQKEPLEEIPNHLKNATTKFAKESGLSKDYKYPHDFPNSYVDQDYLTPRLKEKKYYRPSKNGAELEISQRLKSLNSRKYN